MSKNMAALGGNLYARKEVESWEEPILNLILAVDDAALLLADAEPEEKTSQGATLWGEENNQNMPAS